MDEITKIKPIKCKICGKEYNTASQFSRHITLKHNISKQDYYDKYLKIDPDEGICPVCGEPTKFYGITSGYSKHCSYKCSNSDPCVQETKNKTLEDKYGKNYKQILHENSIKSMLDKYGVENPGQVKEFRDKAKATSLERYGVECNWSSKDPKLNGSATRLQKYGYKNLFESPDIVKQCVQNKYGVDNVFQLEEIKDKIKQTNLNNLGVEYPTQSQIVKDKIKQTNLQNYGVECILQADEIKQQIRKTNLEKYGVECTLEKGSPIREKINQTNLNKYGSISPFGNEEIQVKSITTNFEKYGVPYYCMTSDCKVLHQGDSKPNLEFKNKLITYDLFESDIKNREFSISTYTYDFKLNTNLIEIDPTITHNITVSPYKNSQITVEYHQNKSNLAKQHGYRCIHIWDWDDQDKIITQLLLSKEKIYARKCKLKEVDKKEAKTFIDKNHLQEYAKDEIRVGLYYNNELVSIMTFGKPRYNKNYQYELIRYCSSKNIVGGAEKLFKYFINNYNPNSIVSYCDLSKFNGDTYIKLGFNLKSKNIKPSKHWYNIKTKQHLTDNLLRQRGFDQLLGKQFGYFGKGTSNEQLMLDYGFVEIYDCGQATFIWNNNIGDR